MAIAEAHLAKVYNRPGHEIIDHYVYAIVTDGDLMEGVASEAASLAGHLRLGKLIYLYDDNKVSIEGSTDIAFTEDRGKRFEAYGWHAKPDGLDIEAIDRAIWRRSTRGLAHHGAKHHRSAAHPPEPRPRRGAGRRRARRRQGQAGMAQRAALLRAGRGAGPLPPGRAGSRAEQACGKN
jgi:hypothetical protein